MPTYSYGGLSIRVSADTSDMARTIRRDAENAGAQAARSIGQTLSKGLADVTKASGKALATGLAVATTAAAGFGVASFRTAARVGEMDASLRALAKANNLSEAAMQKAVKAVKGQGIETGVAQTLVAQFARNNLDLAKAQGLATVAQDAAVISGRNSTEVLSDLVHGITTQNSLVLRNAGVNVQAGQAMDQYAKSLGKTRAELTDSERSQAVMNAVMEAGKNVAGAYAAAMEEPGKVLRSFPRVLNQVQEGIGKGLVQAMSQSILSAYKFSSQFAKAVDEGGKLRPVVDAIGQAFSRLVGPLETIIQRATKWLETLTPERVNAIAEAVKRFGPLALAAAGGLTAMVAPNILSGIPGLGPVLSGLAGPMKAVQGTALDLVRSLGNGQGGLGGIISGLTSPIGLLVAGFGLLMVVSPEFRSAIMDIVRALLDGLKPILAAVIQSVRILVPVIVQMAQVFGGVLAAGLRGLLPVFQALATVLRVLEPVLPALIYAWLAYAAATKVVAAAQAALEFAKWIGFVIQYVAQVHLAAVAQGIASVATKVWAAAQWLLNAALTANPIGIVIVAIVALVAGLVIAYQKVGWFRDAVDALGRIIRAVFGAAVQAVVTAFSGWWATNGDAMIKVANAVTAAFRFMAAGITAYLRTLLDQFRAVGAILADVWSVLWTLIRFVATSYFNFVVMQIRVAWAVITGLFQVGMAVITAVWQIGWAAMQAILQVFVAAVTAIVKIWWNLIVGIFTVFLNLITGNWSGAWDAMRQYATQIMNAIRDFLRAWWSAISGMFSTQLGALTSLWSRSWEAIRQTTVAVGSAIRDWMAGLWRQIQQAAASAWTGILNTIKGVWDRLVEVVRGPVRTVVNSVINPLIRGINTLITKIGISEIPQIPGFAEGGRIPGGWGGGDRVLMYGEPGEWVLTKDQAKGIGYDNLKRLPRYQAGGEVGEPPYVMGPSARFPGLGTLRDIGGAFARMTHLDDLASAAKELVDPFLGMLTFAASQAFKLLTEPLRKIVEPMAKSGVVFPTQWLGKTAIDILDKALEFIASKSMGACDAGGVVAHAMTFNGKPYRWGGGANPNTGFDCSSFVSYIAGMAGLPLPGGFRVPSQAHGPVTTDYLSWSGMTSVPLSSASPGDVAVNPSHIGFIIGPGGSGFAARSTATGIGPQNFASGYTYRKWVGGAAGPDEGGGICDPGAGQVAYNGPAPAWAVSILGQVTSMLGIPHTRDAWLAQARTESNFNTRAVNNWDINARNGVPSQGWLQVIPPTFAAYCGPFCGRGILDPLANAYAAVNYGKSRYGARLLQVIGRGHGYAAGGVIGEPVVGVGLRSGSPYTFGERGPEYVSPLAGPDAARVNAAGGRGGPVINVYPSRGMDERALAAAVSRELAWAEAGGTR